MTRDEWIKMTQDALVVLRREISLGQTEEALSTLRAFDDHLRHPPTFEPEVKWVLNKWLSNASKAAPPNLTRSVRTAPQFSFRPRMNPPNVLKFTDEQRDNLLLFVSMIFDGTIALNPKTGAVFPVVGKPGHADKARALAANSFALPKKED